MTEARAPRRPGKVRPARLTDLAALGELSRLCQSDGADTRSLGLPLSGPPIGVFSLFRLPLGAFRPNDLMYVYEQDGRIAGLVRVERESVRDEWTIVELDAVGMADAGDIRYRLVQQLLREGAKRAAARFHVACADKDGNVELLMQAGFMRYGEERILVRPPAHAPPRTVDREADRGRRHPRGTADRCPGPLAPLHGGDPRPHRPPRSPAPQRLGTLGDALAGAALEPRADPALRRRRGLRPGRRPAAGAMGPSSPASSRSGVAKEDQPHYLKVMTRPDVDASALVGFGLGVIAGAVAKDGRHTEHGVIAPVRTYESPIDRRLEDAGFESVASVTLLMKETLVRVAEPALVPAGVR